MRTNVTRVGPLAGSPCDRSTAAKLAPFAVSAAALLLYALTLSRDVGLGDSAELALQAWKLGVTHPPGYPLHSLLGHAFGFVFADPALATNALSAASAALAAGLLTRFALNCSINAGPAAMAGLVFAFLPTVWEHAIKTEIYTLNTCVLAVALLLGQSVRRKRSTFKLVLLAAILGVSLGSSMANVLLLPGFALLVTAGVHHRPRDLLLAVTALFLTGAGVTSWNLIRSQTMLPMGTAFVPDTVANLARFLTGSQYATWAARSPSFIVERILAHSRAWAESFLWIGCAYGLFGIYDQWRRDRRLLVALLCMFAANWGYFTTHPWLDYQDMVMTSHFLFCIFVAAGIDGSNGMSRHAAPRISLIRRVCSTAIPLALLLVLTLAGLREHWPERRERPAAVFADLSMQRFPTNAVVIARWDLYAPLCYLQQTRDIRTDVRLVERAYQVRHYPWGTVEDWRELAREAAKHRPVLIDGIDSKDGDQAGATVNNIWLRYVPDDGKGTGKTEPRP